MKKLATVQIEEAPHRYNASRMYAKGRTIDQIALFYHVRNSRVSTLFKEMKIPRQRPGRKLKYDREEFRRLYVEERLSIKQIADRYNTCGETVRRALVDIGVAMRPPHVNYTKRHSPHLPVIRTLLARGFSQEYIVKVTGQSPHSVRLVEVALGAPPRTSPLYRVWVERLAREAA